MDKFIASEELPELNNEEVKRRMNSQGDPETIKGYKRVTVGYTPFKINGFQEINIDGVPLISSLPKAEDANYNQTNGRVNIVAALYLLSNLIRPFCASYQRLR